MPGISVIIPTMGGGDITHMLTSLYPAGFDLDKDELVLVSHGRLPRVYQAFIDIALPGKFISLDRPPKSSNNVPSYPFNQGQLNATKEYLWFIDDDDSAEPGAFETIRENVGDGLTVFQARSKEGRILPPEPDPYQRFYTLTMVVKRTKSVLWSGGSACDTRFGREVLKHTGMKKVEKVIARHKH